jgi:NAD(P)-dependent dehydrogenase (short-subunit alcohol dehydrogenase family)
MPGTPDTTYSLFSLEGSTAVVTGAGRGLGRTLAHGLASAGAHVIVSDVVADAAAAVASEIVAAGGSAVAAHVDVASRDSCAQLIERAVSEFGRLDTLVNNAAIDLIEPFDSVRPDSWQRVLDINLSGVFHCSQLAAAVMVKQGGGSIINISSIAASAGIRQLASYSAAKAGVNQLTRVMALELAPRGVRVNAIAPGYLENVMRGAIAEHADPEKEQQIRAFTPLGRRARLDELIGPVTFLASRAASYVTGAVLAVDGGYTAI